MGLPEAGEIWLRKGAEVVKELQCMKLLGEILMKRGETEEANKFLQNAAEIAKSFRQEIINDSSSQMPTKKLKSNTN